MLSKYEKMFFFDLETTGLDYKKDHIIEIGIICLAKGKNGKFIPSSNIDHFVKINYSIPEEIVNLTHITDQMVQENGLQEKEIVNMVTKMIDEKTLIIGYNVQFDICFLTEMVRRVNNDDKFYFDNDLLDVLAVYKDQYPYPHKLCDAIKTFDIETQNTHRAIDDILATVDVLRELIRKLKQRNIDIDKYINVFGFNSKYGISGEKQKRVKYIALKNGKREIEKM